MFGPTRWPNATFSIGNTIIFVSTIFSNHSETTRTTANTHFNNFLQPLRNNSDYGQHPLNSQLDPNPHYPMPSILRPRPCRRDPDPGCISIWADPLAASEVAVANLAAATVKAGY